MCDCRWSSVVCEEICKITDRGRPLLNGYTYSEKQQKQTRLEIWKKSELNIIMILSTVHSFQCQK